MKSILKKTATDDEINERNDIDQFGEYILDVGNMKDLKAQAIYISKLYKNNGNEINMRIIDKEGVTRHTFDENGIVN